ncbi:hypothetical protein EV426DRAFT_699059 [Tirmania nivea]|nr:hypothetical protein EV426DRAFT_699059 [Tirmania nivea]
MNHFPVTTDAMRTSLLMSLLALLALATPTTEHYLTVSVVSILGSPKHAHRLGPGYIPTAFIDKSLRFAYSGEDWDKQCMEASRGDTTNGKLVRVTDTLRIQVYTCDGGLNQEWVALRDTRKIANVGKPNLCLSPIGDSGLLGAVDCSNAKDIGVTKKV